MTADTVLGQEAGEDAGGRKQIAVSLQCRFYENEFPVQDEVVIVKVKDIQEMGAYCVLEEYNNIQGMLMHSELSRRRIRSINKIIQVGKEQCVVVFKVDKGYIDLSKRRVFEEEQKKCEDRYAKARAVNSILRLVAAKLQYTEQSQLENLYSKTAWMFDKKSPLGSGFGSYDYFKRVVYKPELLNECDVDDHTRAVLLEEILKRMTPQSVKLRAEIELTCYSYHGINAIKEALKAGQEKETEDMKLKIHLIAPPTYTISTTTMKQEAGIKVITAALDNIEQVLVKSGGNYKLKVPPKAITETDEANLEEVLRDLEAQNREVGGDDDAEDNEVVDNSDGQE